MTTTTTRLPVFVDATIAALSSILSPIPVFDGPMIVDGSIQTWCIVGGDGAEDLEPRLGSFDQTWAGLGARARDEAIDIHCALVAWSGDEGTFKAVRDVVFNALALIELNLLANLQEGIAANVLWTQLTSGEIFQANTTAGPRARLPFTIHARNRI